MEGFKANSFCKNKPCMHGNVAGLEVRIIVRSAGQGKFDMELCVIGVMTLDDVMSGNSKYSIRDNERKGSKSRISRKP